MPKLFTVQNNTAPPIVLTLERSDNPINVTGATVDLYINLTGTVVNTGHTSCALTTPAAGVVTYTTHASDFTTPGVYNCEIKISYGDGTIETLYQKFQVSSRVDLQ